MSCLILSLSGLTAQAGDRIGIGVKAGTYGLGVDLTGRVNDWFSIRGSFDQLDYTDSFNASDIDYDGKLKLGGYGVLLDFFPAKGNFRPPRSTSATAPIRRRRSERSTGT